MNSIFHEFNKILFTENRFFILSYRLLRNFPPSSKQLHNSHNLKIYAEALSYDRGSFYQWSIRNIINSVVINWPESLQFSSENILYVILIVMQKRQKYAITYVYVDYDWFGTVKLETYFDRLCCIFVEFKFHESLRLLEEQRHEVRIVLYLTR